jgi:hypothetical protein
MGLSRHIKDSGRGELMCSGQGPVSARIGNVRESVVEHNGQYLLIRDGGMSQSIRGLSDPRVPPQKKHNDLMGLGSNKQKHGCDSTMISWDPRSPRFQRSPLISTRHCSFNEQGLSRFQFSGDGQQIERIFRMRQPSLAQLRSQY